MKLEDMTLEEKVDEILKYQKKLHHAAVARAIFSFLTFLILVVLPIAGAFYLVDYVANNIGLSMTEIGEALQNVRGVTEISGVDNLKNLLN